MRVYKENMPVAGKRNQSSSLLTPAYERGGGWKIKHTLHLRMVEKKRGSNDKRSGSCILGFISLGRFHQRVTAAYFGARRHGGGRRVSLSARRLYSWQGRSNEQWTKISRLLSCFSNLHRPWKNLTSGGLLVGGGGVSTKIQGHWGA